MPLHVSMPNHKNAAVRFVAVVTVLALTLSTSIVLAYTANVVSKNIDLAGGQSLRTPTDLVQFSDDKFCFLAASSACNDETCPQSLLCTFDFENFSSVDVTLPFCGNKGVVLGNQLHCPMELLPAADEDATVLSFSAVSFTAGDNGLEESINNEDTFDFDFKKSKVDAKSIVLNGNIFHNSAGSYYSVATLIDDENQMYYAFFSSNNGFSWSYVSMLPFKHSTVDHFHGFSRGDSRVAVSAVLNDGRTQTVSSGYGGKFWSSIRTLNTTVTPSAINYPSSGVRVEYATSNSSSVNPVVLTDDKQNATVLDVLTPSDTASSVILASKKTPDGNEITMVHDADDGTTKSGRQLKISKALLDDSEEVKKREAEIAKKKEEADKREAARLKAQIERQEKQRKERRARIKREEERREKFQVDDAPNIERALKTAPALGEVVVIRKVSKDTIDLEKQSFFDF